MLEVCVGGIKTEAMTIEYIKQRIYSMKIIFMKSKVLRIFICRSHFKDKELYFLVFWDF